MYACMSACAWVYSCETSWIVMKLLITSLGFPHMQSHAWSYHHGSHNYCFQLYRSMLRSVILIIKVGGSGSGKLIISTFQYSLLVHVLAYSIIHDSLIKYQPTHLTESRHPDQKSSEGSSCICIACSKKLASYTFLLNLYERINC